jgi:hypothetical protein
LEFIHADTLSSGDHLRIYHPKLLRVLIKILACCAVSAGTNPGQLSRSAQEQNSAIPLICFPRFFLMIGSRSSLYCDSEPYKLALLRNSHDAAALLNPKRF